MYIEMLFAGDNLVSCEIFVSIHTLYHNIYNEYNPCCLVTSGNWQETCLFTKTDGKQIT